MQPIRPGRTGARHHTPRSSLRAAKALIALAALPVAGCAGNGDVPPVDEEPAPTVSQRGPIDEETAILRAKAAVVDRTGGRAGDVEVKSVKWQEWPDSSLGCAKPGQSYLTVITPGRQVLLAWAGQSFDVRVADSGRVVVCSAPGVRSLRGTPMAFSKNTLGSAQQVARADLASNLGIPEEDVSFVKVRRRSFPDNTLGCPGTVDTVIDAPVSAYVFTLSARGTVYTYHSDLERTFACPPFVDE
jgi:hypothetical protein